MASRNLHLTNFEYRPDIDGLRAIAVLAVIIFHAFPSILKGGFIGVDVFFVISGYLISSIIFKNLEQGTFNIFSFYARRIKRIFPALIIVLISSLLIGWFCLLQEEYKQLGKHVAAGASFISNVVLWSEAGYFDNTAETKPLLNLWSLGVEEQFYILWPILMLFAWNHRYNLITLIILLAITSFTLNIEFVSKDSVAAFYSPQTRFWELFSGGILSLGSIQSDRFARVHIPTTKSMLITWISYKQRPNLTNCISITGLLLLAYGFWQIDKESAFPGIWALIPVVGSSLLIIAGPNSWFNRTILSSRAAVWLGLISYPLYLWHWPLLSFARIVASGTPSINIRVSILILSVVLASITRDIVERPIRKNRNEKFVSPLLLIFMAFIGCTGFYDYYRNGFPLRNVIKLNNAMETGIVGGAQAPLENACGITDEEMRRKFKNCVTDYRKPTRFALIGDSKAEALFSGLVRTSTDKGRWLFIGGTSLDGSPVPVISEADVYKNFQQFSRTAIKAVADNEEIETVVLVTATRALFSLPNDYDIEELPLSNNYSPALDGLQNSVKALVASGKKVVLVVDNPTLPHPEDCLTRITEISFINKILVRYNKKCSITIERHLLLSDKYRKLLNEVRDSFPNNVSIFDTMKYLCDVNKGTCTHRRDERQLYGYTDHISDYASGLIGHAINENLTGEKE